MTDNGTKVTDRRADGLDEELGRAARRGMPMPPSIAKGLVKAMAAAKHVRKDGTNEHHGYKYATAEDVIAEARDALTAGGVSVLAESWGVTTRTVRYLERDEKGAVSHVDEDEDSIVVRYLLISAEGDSWRPDDPVQTPVLPEKGRPPDKAQHTALTFNLAYFLRSLLLLARRMPQEKAVDERDDREYQPKQRGAKAPPKKPPPAQEAPKDAADVRLGFSKLAGTPMGKLKVEQLQWVVKQATSAIERNDPKEAKAIATIYRPNLEAAVVLLARIEAASLPLDPETGEEKPARLDNVQVTVTPPAEAGIEESGCGAQDGEVVP